MNRQHQNDPPLPPDEPDESALEEEEAEAEAELDPEAALEFVEEQREPAVADQDVVDAPASTGIEPPDGPPRRNSLPTPPDELGRRFLQDATGEGERELERRPVDPSELVPNKEEPTEEEGTLFEPEEE